MTPNPDIFHAHLDKCAQCREHPFDLCRDGAGLLREAAIGLPPRQPGKVFNFAPDHFGGPIRFAELQNIPIRTELGKEIRNVCVAPAQEALADTDLSAVEARVMAAFTATDGKFVCAECGCETNTSMVKPCISCGSVKVVLLSLVEKLFGKNWRECFR